MRGFKWKTTFFDIEKAKGSGERWQYTWNGNTPLHEWNYKLEDRPKTIKDEFGFELKDKPEPIENLVTWIFEEGSFKPTAKIVDEKSYSIITDYLGTPIQAYDERGILTWERELNIYGATREEKGISNFVPFMYQGQYHDTETGLYYNRFRYYSPEEGVYISQDPIGLEGGTALYVYVHDSNYWIDVFGLAKHHTTPREVYNPRTNKRKDGTKTKKDPILPNDVAKNKDVRGTKSNPNMWNIPDDVHANIHNPNSDISKKNGGDYNAVFKNRVKKWVIILQRKMC